MNTFKRPPTNGREPTEKTENHYHRLAQQLVNRFERKTGVSVFDHPRRFEVFLMGVLENVTPNTRRSYLAALRNYAPTKEMNLTEIFSRTSWPTKQQIITEHGARTVSKRAKRLPNENLQAIMDAIKQYSVRIRSDRWITILAMLLCGKAFGLRPSEWRTATIVKDIPEAKRAQGFIAKLEVKNAKVKPDSSFTTRSLWIHESTDLIERKAAEWLIDRVSVMDDELFRNEYRKMCALLRRLQIKNPSIQLRGKFIMLYSARHQFASEAKAHGFSNAEIAAMLGHSSYEKQEIYGKRRFGRGGGGNGKPFPAAPEPEEVAAVAAHVQTLAAARAWLKRTVNGAPDQRNAPPDWVRGPK